MKAELLTPQFISEYCENCHNPIQGEAARFNEHLPHNTLLTKIERHYCLGCVEEVIAYRLRMRNVSDMTLDLKEAHQWEMHREVSWKITPFRRVKHI